MFFLNLTAGEFLTLLGALSGLITTLYLLDRTRRKKVVSTLRFWNPAFAAEQQQSRKRVREPWSLLLQLLSLLLLLLAIAQLEWGTREGRGRDHVLLLDTSSSSGQANSDGTVLDREKAVAQQYLGALPARDRVMLVRADALSAPATAFTANRQQLRQAIRESVPTFSALNIAQALSFARQAGDWSGGQSGEVVYVGPKLVDDIPTLKVDRLRVITVPASRENAGLRSIAVKRGDAEANSWQATVTLKNNGTKIRQIQLRAAFAGTVFAPRALTLRPGQETAALYTFVTNTKGRFTAAIEPARQPGGGRSGFARTAGQRTSRSGGVQQPSRSFEAPSRSESPPVREIHLARGVHSETGCRHHAAGPIRSRAGSGKRTEIAELVDRTAAGEFAAAHRIHRD